MNKYRVDRTKQLTVPAGMRSIIYIGDDPAEALEVFRNEPDDNYGVILSEWSDDAQRYEIIGFRCYEEDY